MNRWKEIQWRVGEFPPIMYWAAIAEDMQGNTFKDNMNLFQISKLPIQLDFIYGAGSGCQAGCCTD